MTSTEIRIGVLQPDLGSASRLGIATGDGDPGASSEAYRLWADEINAAGGILGRRLTVTVAKYDRLAGGPAGFRAACLQLVEEVQSFIVFDPSGSFTPVGQACVTQEHKRLLLGPNAGLATEYLNAAAGRLMTNRMSAERQWDATARLAHQDGVLKGRKIGVVTSEFPAENAATNRGLVPRLKALGYTVAHQTTLSGDIATAQSQMSVQVTQMRTKGIDLVFLVTNLFYSQLWAQQGDAQRWTPLYGSADMGFAATDSALANMPPSYQAFAYSVLAAESNKNVGEARPQAPIEAQCLNRYETFTRRRLAADTHDPERVRQVSACEFLSFFRDVAASVGPQLTTDAMTARTRTIGAASHWWGEPTLLSFAAGKYDAADTMRKVVVQRPCPKDPDDPNGCWVPAGSFRRVA